jgi:hypothetical protein
MLEMKKPRFSVAFSWGRFAVTNDEVITKPTLKKQTPQLFE